MGVEILAQGFNQSEANNEGVSVEEIPFGERGKHGRSGGLPYDTYAEYNLNQCDHPVLEKCASQMNDIMYGTLSHSHILLVLRGLANGATWKVEDEPHMSALLNPDGAFDKHAVAYCDLDLGRVLSDGLMMEI